MKSQEYAFLLQEKVSTLSRTVPAHQDPLKESVRQILIDLSAEARDILQNRKISSPKGIFSVLKEINQKWISICNKLNIQYPDLNKEAFADLITAEVDPTFKSQLEASR